MTVEQQAADLIKKYIPLCAGNSQTILNSKLAKKAAIQDCQSTIEELKDFRSLFFGPTMKNYIKDRIHFYTQVIEQLNK